MLKPSARFSDVVIRALRYWPNKVSTSDRIITIVGNEVRIRFPTLSQAEDQADPQLLSENDEFGHLLNWTLYTILHKIAQMQEAVFPQMVYHGYLRHAFEESLKDDMYQTIAKEYWESNSRHP
ncbi:hypothetical protein [Azospirillum sp. TSO22-1]|uniref:hypothetical protein n=1 Tax=Azospirillum sp. TSO22-1 TaxID=716789 RepID=UPI0011B78410|nr:hypothetical protein [Azospirillum sp. TSO22-1]